MEGGARHRADGACARAGGRAQARAEFAGACARGIAIHLRKIHCCHRRGVPAQVSRTKPGSVSSRSSLGKVTPRDRFSGNIEIAFLTYACQSTSLLLTAYYREGSPNTHKGRGALPVGEFT